MNTIIFDKYNDQLLADHIENLQKKGAVLGYYQLQGLLFAVACSPEPVAPSEWFDLIWLNDEPQFDTEEDAKAFYQAMVRFAEYIEHMVRERHFTPFGTQYSESWHKELAQWCDGMLMGHQYLEDIWMFALDDLQSPDLTEDIDASLCLACTFADIAKARHISLEQGIALTDEHLPEAYLLFIKVLEAYSSVKDLLEYAPVDEGSPEALFHALEPVALDKPCPCHSGLIFSKCCLH